MKSQEHYGVPDQGVADPQDDSDAMEWLVFEVAGEHYCQPVGPVKEVLRYEPPIPVPGAARYVCGITNVRGEVLTVLSAHQLLDVEPGPVGEHTRVITFELAGGHYGLMVDGVSEILRLRPEQMEHSGQPPSGGDDGLLQGTFSISGNAGNSLVIAVDIAGFILKHLD